MPNLYPVSIKHLHKSCIVKYLGSGGYADVKLYKCREKEVLNGKLIECKECFVVKQLKINRNKWNFWNLKKKNNDNLLKKKLLKEFTIGTLLNHPNIRKTIDIDIIDNCIIFEYCDGMDFYNYLREYNPSLVLDKKMFYFKQIVEAVEYIHDLGIAHMDIKLENIMVNIYDEKIKLIDFGEACICKINDEKITHKGIHGSYPYMAPEQFTENHYDALKVDIWSLGIILYEIIFNKMPWRKAIKDDVKYRNFYKKYNDDLDIFLPLLDKKSSIYLLFVNILKPDPLLRCNIKFIKNLL